MQPINPEKNIFDKTSILKRLGSDASSDEFEEYEKLISKRFRRDPSQVDPDLERLKELEYKLFGPVDDSIHTFVSIKKEMESRGDFSVEKASEDICKFLKEIQCKN